MDIKEFQVQVELSEKRILETIQSELKRLRHLSGLAPVDVTVDGHLVESIAVQPYYEVGRVRLVYML